MTDDRDRDAREEATRERETRDVDTTAPVAEPPREPKPDETFWTDRKDEPHDTTSWLVPGGELPDEDRWPIAGDTPPAETFDLVEPDVEPLAPPLRARAPDGERAPAPDGERTPAAGETRDETAAFDPYVRLRPEEPIEPARSGLPSIEELTFQVPPPARAGARSAAKDVAPEEVRFTEPRPFRPTTLSKRRAATLALFAEALLPRGGSVPQSASDVGVPERLDASIAAWAPEARRRFSRTLGFFEWSSLFSRNLKRFSKLRPEQAAQTLERASHSSWLLRRGAFDLIKFYAGNQWAATSPVESAIGYTYSCLSSAPPRDGEKLEVLSFPQVNRDHVEDCDVVVVGSGAGGAVVAKEMAELGLSVVVLEEGAYFTRNDFTGPPFDRFQRLYRQQGMTGALGSPPIPIPLGMGVGGSTLVNSGSCFRTPYRVLLRWERETGVEGIDGDSMKTYFDRVERIQRVKPVPDALLGSNARVFERGVRALGLQGAPMQRAIEGCRGCGTCSFGCPSDAKLSTHLTYLPRAQKGGATIYANTRAERVHVENGRARGVLAYMLDPVTREKRVWLRVRAKVVVIAAGAIHTPSLLAENAIGNASGQLGHNLRIHPATAVGAFFDEEIFGWRGTLQPYFVSDWHESNDVMIEVTSSVPSIGAGSFPGTGARYKQLLGAYPHLASAGLFVSDTSKGRVVRRPGREPVITYRLNKHDTARMVEGMVRTAQIFLAAGARAVHTGIPGVEPITSRQDLDEIAKNHVRPRAMRLTAFHPVGTARMGVDPASSVAGPFGEVHGVPGLFIADASVLPGCPTVNPMITIMAFATRTADHMARHGSKYF